MRISLHIDIPTDIGRMEGLPVLKRAAKSGILTELLSSFRQRNGIKGQSRDADRYLELLRASVNVEGVILP